MAVATSLESTCVYPKLGAGLGCNQSPLWDRSVLLPHFTLQEIETRGQEPGLGPRAQQWQHLARTRSPKPTPHTHTVRQQNLPCRLHPPSLPTQNPETRPQTQRLHQPRRDEGSCPQPPCCILTHSPWGPGNMKNHQYSYCLFKSITLFRRFPGGPAVKTPCRGLGGSLVRELDPWVITKTRRSQTN